MSTLFSFLRYVSLAGFIVAAACAQVERGTISGSVNDPSGGAVPNAPVTVKNVNTGITVSISSNQAGDYVAPDLIPGEYTVTVTQAGFNTTSVTGIVLHVNERLVADVTLAIGAVSQSVEVGATAPLLQSETASVGNVITRREVSQLLLNGRTIYQLAYLNPGVTAAIPSQNANNTSIPDNGRAAQGLSVNGQRQSNNTFILDGVYNNQINQGLIGTKFGSPENAISSEGVLVTIICTGLVSASFTPASAKASVLTRALACWGTFASGIQGPSTFAAEYHSVPAFR